VVALGEHQGCQMVYFHTKNPSLGTFWRALELKMLAYKFYSYVEYFTATLYNVWRLFGIDCDQMVYFPRCGMFGTRKIWQPW
jgi:hypothetical protein